MKRIRLDWTELRDAFLDRASEHRFYLDRETGAVHFFSTYLDNEEEAEDEGLMSSDRRYARIPQPSSDAVRSEMREFIGSLGSDAEQRTLLSAVGTDESESNFYRALTEFPTTSTLWKAYSAEKLDERISRWLGVVGVEPL